MNYPFNCHQEDKKPVQDNCAKKYSKTRRDVEISNPFSAMAHLTVWDHTLMMCNKCIQTALRSHYSLFVNSTVPKWKRDLQISKKLEQAKKEQAQRWGGMPNQTKTKVQSSFLDSVIIVSVMLAIISSEGALVAVPPYDYTQQQQRPLFEHTPVLDNNFEH